MQTRDRFGNAKQHHTPSMLSIPNDPQGRLFAAKQTRRVNDANSRAARTCVLCTSPEIERIVESKK